MKIRRIDFTRARKSPLAALVGHFVRRLFASEEEQDSGGVGLGLGAVLAILASPGAFASIFLMGKYSTLLQWLRGEHIDAIRRSPSDEYFFVVLSMTITGLVMVTRWNRLFPDARDFSNLAVLPIPIRHIFLANFAALLGLALLIGFDVNVVSALLFPFFITISIGTLSASLRVGVSHAVTVFSASLFSFFAVFALVGVLMLVVPRRISRPVSIALRILLVIGLLSEFFSNILLRLFAGRSPESAAGYMRWVPSFWFLGIYERLLDIARPRMLAMANHASFALGAAIVVSVVAYALCYRRIFLRLPESFDSMGGSRPLFTIKWPEALLRPLFRSQFERACSSFALKVLMRSEQHLLFFGAYLGVGLVLVAQTAVDSDSGGVHASLPSPEYLSIPFLIAFFLITGLRFVFDKAAVFPANWVFRITADSPSPKPAKVARRLMLWTTIPWELCVLLPIPAGRMGWLLALLHVAAVIASTVLFADLMLLRFCKIPFTCSAQFDVKQLLVQMLGLLFSALAFVPALASLERWMLERPVRFCGLAVSYSLAWYSAARYRQEQSAAGEQLRFEEGPGAPFELLKLS